MHLDSSHHELAQRSVRSDGQLTPINPKEALILGRALVRGNTVICNSSRYLDNFLSYVFDTKAAEHKHTEFVEFASKFLN